MPRQPAVHLSMEARQAAVQALEHIDIDEVCKIYNVSTTSLKIWQRKWETTHDLSHKRSANYEHPRAKFKGDDKKRLFDYLDAHPHSKVEDVMEALQLDMQQRVVRRYMEKHKTERRQRYEHEPPEVDTLCVPGNVPLYHMVFSNITLDQIGKVSKVMGECIPDWGGDMMTEAGTGTAE